MEEQTRYVTWEVHNEFTRRVDDQEKRQDARIADLEGSVKQISDLVASVKVLATQMENMAKEQAKQGARLEAIEQKPSKRWDAIITGIIGAVVGAIGAALMAGIIH